MNWAATRLFVCCLAILPLACLIQPAIATVQTNTTTPVVIGVLAHRGVSNAMRRWKPTAEYLSAQLPGYSFSVSALDLGQLEEAVGEQAVDFVLTNPGHYVELEARYGISRIATLESCRDVLTCTRYGAVILTRTDNDDVVSIHDLRNQTFMAVSPDAFGGFQMAWRVLAANDIDPFEDFSSLDFVGFPQDQIVYAVQDGKVDAGTVRASTLARMAEEDLIDPADFRILNQQNSEHYRYPLSTQLYPEWPFAKARQTDSYLAERVALALLQLDPESPAAKASRTAGWTIPLDYHEVYDLMSELKIGPYKHLREASPTAFFRRYVHWFLIAAVLVVLLAAANVYVSRTNRKLRTTEHALRDEIEARRSSHHELEKYRDSLQQQVEERTRDLAQTNEGLEKSRQALGRLVAIAGAPELVHKQRLLRLLEAAQAYYAVPAAILSLASGERRQSLLHTGQAELVPQWPTDKVDRCLLELLKTHGEPLDVPDIVARVGRFDECRLCGWKSYIGIAVQVKDDLYAILEFAGTRSRQSTFSNWDHELLKVMAQWIGDEIERQSLAEERQQHQAELARVSRLTSIGEMAASLAHELNQPLTGAVNYSSGCLRRLKSNDPDRNALITGMERTIESATLAADIIRNIREFVQKGDAERVPLELSTAATNVLALMSAEFERHGIEVELATGTTSARVVGNLVQLEQVILNFMRNAIDAIIASDSAERRVTITITGESDMYCLAVNDTGSGIAADVLPQIFDAFYTTNPDGMGIGLSISRSIIESHHGRIDVSPGEKSGATFSFSLPVAG